MNAERDKDPDGNTIGFRAANFATEAQYQAFMASEAFQRNPRGTPIDAEELLAALDSNAI